jgi:hypothetical protein
VLESLIKCGAFDSTGAHRAQLMAVLDEAMEQGQKLSRDRLEGQTNMFGAFTQAAPTEQEAALPPLPPWREADLLSYEKEALGFYITGHPLSRYKDEIRRLSSLDTVTVQAADDNMTVRLAGLATEIKEKVTKKGDRMAFVGYAFFPDESRGFTRADAAAGSSRPGISADEEAALASVRAAKAGGATVVVLAHGGTEYVERPSEAARALYARFVDAGAALVIGTHPHLLQGCEARSGSLIAYSLGNFLFTLEDEPREAWKGAMLDFLVYRGLVRGVVPRPIVAGYDHTELDADGDAAEARFSRLCREIAALPPMASR